MRSLIGAVILAVAPSLTEAQVVTVQEALLRAKPAVALVVTEVNAEVAVRCAPGAAEVRATPPPFRQNATGFFLSPSGWTITNAHVVAPAHEPPKWLPDQAAERGVRAACLPALLERRGLAPGERPDVEDQLVRQLLVSVVPTARTTLDPSVSIILSNGVRLPAKVVKISPPLTGEAMSGRDLALLQVEAADMPALTLADSTQAQLGDKLSIIGFPRVVMTHELLNSSATVEASVTLGAISGFKQDRANQPVIQTDAAAEAGGSGGPVVNAEGNVVGVLTFVTEGGEGANVQGFNFVIPSAAVRDFLKDTPVKLDEPSRFNAAWHAGLRDFFAGNYSGAARRFTEANRLLPELPDVRRISGEAAERAKTQPLLPWGRVGALLVAVGVVGYGIVLQRRWSRGRYRIRASDVARLLDSAEAPVILDVREQSAYDKSPVRIPRSLRVSLEHLESGGDALPVEPTRPVVAYCS